MPDYYYWHEKMISALDEIDSEAMEEKFEEDVLKLAQDLLIKYEDKLNAEADNWADGVPMSDMHEAVDFRVRYVRSHLSNILDNLSTEILR